MDGFRAATPGQFVVYARRFALLGEYASSSYIKGTRTAAFEISTSFLAQEAPAVVCLVCLLITGVTQTGFADTQCSAAKRKAPRSLQKLRRLR